jgi:hypothetical protein
MTFVAGIPEHVKSNPHIRLLIGCAMERADRLGEAATILASVRSDDVAGISSFEDARHRAIASLISKCAAVVGQIGATLDSPAISDFASAMPHTAEFAQLKQAKSRDEFVKLLDRVVFGRAAGSSVPLANLNTTLLDLQYNPHIDNRFAALRYFVSLRLIAEAEQVARQILQSNMQRDAEFVRSAVRLGEIVGTSGTEWTGLAAEIGATINADDGDDVAQHGEYGRIRSREVAARELRRKHATAGEFIRIGALPPTATVASDDRSTAHLFIGFFGQMRFSDVVLPEMVAYLEGEMGYLRESGGLITYGAATWSHSGERRLGPLDDSEYLFARMPLEIAHVIRGFAGGLIRDVAAIFPAVTARVLSVEASSTVVTEDTFAGLFSKGVVSKITHDHDFIEDAGVPMAGWCGGEINHMNQARMWNRIGAIGELLRASERAQSVPVTHALLIRPDLRITHGSLGALLKESSERRSNWVVLDHDPHAEFLEGFGDRYMLGDRAAMDRLFDGERLMHAVLSPNAEVDAGYKRRLGGHRFLSSILFEHGTMVSSVGSDRFAFEIYRGRQSIESVRAALQSDLASLENPELRDAVERALTSV